MTFDLLNLYSCDKDPAQLWTGALGVLMTTKELSQACVTREANLEAEILLNLGNTHTHTHTLLNTGIPPSPQCVKIL